MKDTPLIPFRKSFGGSELSPVSVRRSGGATEAVLGSTLARSSLLAMFSVVVGREAGGMNGVFVRFKMC